MPLRRFFSSTTAARGGEWGCWGAAAGGVQWSSERQEEKQWNSEHASFLPSFLYLLCIYGAMSLHLMSPAQSLRVRV